MWESLFILRKDTCIPQSEFVEVAGRIKSPLFRHYIYVNLRIAGAVCKNLPFTCNPNILLAYPVIAKHAS